MCFKKLAKLILASLLVFPSYLPAQSTGGTVIGSYAPGLVTTTNYAQSNSGFEKNLSGWKNYKAGTIRPTGVTTGTSDLTVARSTSSPLSGVGSMTITHPTSSSQGSGVYFNFTIDRKDRNSVLQLDYVAELVSGTYINSSATDSDLIINVYDITGAKLLEEPTNLYVNVGSTGQNITPYPIQIKTSDSTSYRLFIHSATTNTSAFVVKFDDFVIGKMTKTNSSLPVIGEIIVTGNKTPPTGFLYCDGTSYLISQYPALASSLYDTSTSKYAYGSADSTHFNVPDLRGQFLRGVSDGQTTDPDRTTRTAINTGGNTGDKVGSKEGDVFQGHYHVYNLPVVWGTYAGATPNYYAGTNSPGNSGTPNGGGYGGSVGAPTTDVSNGTPRTSSETRPTNINVAYHIRYMIPGIAQSTSAVNAIAKPTVQKLTNSTGTYTVPTNPKPAYLKIRMVGGGGGGGGSGSGGGNGTAGGNTTFGTQLYAGGGALGVNGGLGNSGGGGGSASLGTITSGFASVGAQGNRANGYTYNQTSSYTLGGLGGISPLGYGTGGTGGGSGATLIISGNGGGAGGLVEALIPIDASSPATYSYTVGAAGSAGGAGANGYAGGPSAPGIIYIEEYYLPDFTVYSSAVNQSTTTIITAAYSAKASDYLLANATSESITVTLPPISTSLNAKVIIKKTDAGTNTVTVNGYSSSELIEGRTSQILQNQYDIITLVCDGTNWIIGG